MPAHHPIFNKASVLPLGEDASKPSGQLRSGHRVALKDGGHLAVECFFVGLGKRFGGQDHDRDLARRLIGAKRLDYVESTQVGHHQIEQDQARHLGPGHGDTFSTAGRLEHSKPSRFEKTLQQVQVGRLVVHDQNAYRIGCRLAGKPVLAQP